MGGERGTNGVQRGAQVCKEGYRWGACEHDGGPVSMIWPEVTSRWKYPVGCLVCVVLPLGVFGPIYYLMQVTVSPCHPCPITV